MERRMKIVYWSDYACPYCYIGEARLLAAIRELGMEDAVELAPKAFELDPGAPREVESDTLTRFARKYRLSPREAQGQIDYISALGRDCGIDFRYATTQYTNTFDAHRLMKLALSKDDREIAEKTNKLLFDAYFTKNLKLADHEVLLNVGREAGLDEKEVREVLDSDRFGPEVRADEREATERGVRGVPFFLFPGGATIPGALSREDFVSLLKREAGAISGAQCGPDGCVWNGGK
ncbi:MAG: DsbA family oxidoreductase [Desulfovibrio sp.]|nr:DsbA family oxidoreductase [Desulfovibrio sp.]